MIYTRYQATSPSWIRARREALKRHNDASVNATLIVLLSFAVTREALSLSRHMPSSQSREKVRLHETIHHPTTPVQSAYLLGRVSSLLVQIPCLPEKSPV